MAAVSGWCLEATAAGGSARAGREVEGEEQSRKTGTKADHKMRRNFCNKRDREWREKKSEEMKKKKKILPTKD